MYSFEFLALIDDDPDGGYHVTFPDVPEAITGGSTIEEARANAAEALGLALRGVLALGRPLPRPVVAGAHLVPVAVGPETAMKLAVIEAFRAAGISKTELARRLGKQEAEARRILDPDHGTRADMLAAALAALGKQVVVEVRDAA